MEPNLMRTLSRVDKFRLLVACFSRGIEKKNNNNNNRAINIRRGGLGPVEEGARATEIKTLSLRETFFIYPPVIYHQLRIDHSATSLLDREV